MSEKKTRDPKTAAEKVVEKVDSVPDDADSHGTPFKRVPGPGPKDEGKGAAGGDTVEPIRRR